MTRRSWAAVVLTAAGVLALIAGLSWQRIFGGDSQAPSSRLDGAALLKVALPDAAGREQSLEQWRGKIVVVNFWATWCEPCREEMPRFVKLQDEYADKGLQFVGIAIDDAEKVRRFSSEIRLNYPTLLGGYGAIELSRAAGNPYGALPFTVVIDRSGTIVYTRLGPVKDAQFRGIVRQLL